MSTAAERATQLDLVARLKSSYPELPDAPTPDLLDHARFVAYMKPVHDVGGEPDAPMKYENKDYEYWEHMTYVICEVLAWRGIWLSEERRRIGNVDVQRAVYLGFPYYGRWLLSVARVLVEKHHIGLTELSERMAEVQERYAGGLAGKTLEAQPEVRGRRIRGQAQQPHRARAGQGRSAGVRGQGGRARSSRWATRWSCGSCPVLFYTRTPEYVRGATGEIAAVAYESPAAEDETWDIPDAKPEWFYVVQFTMAELWDDFNGPATDTLRTEIPEHWLHAAN